MATGGGVLVRLNVATSCSARKDDARRVALSLVVGVVIQTGDEGIVNPPIPIKNVMTSGASERCVAPISQPSYGETRKPWLACWLGLITKEKALVSFN